MLGPRCDPVVIDGFDDVLARARDGSGEAFTHIWTDLSRPVAWPYDWRDQVTSAEGRLLHYGRGRGVGGSSSTNGGVAMRPEPVDVDRWGDGWRWDDLLPDLSRIERDVDFGDRPWHGADGPVPIERWPRDTWSPLQAGFVDGCRHVGFPMCEDHNEPGTTGDLTEASPRAAIPVPVPLPIPAPRPAPKTDDTPAPPPGSPPGAPPAEPPPKKP